MKTDDLPMRYDPSREVKIPVDQTWVDEAERVLNWSGQMRGIVSQLVAPGAARRIPMEDLNRISMVLAETASTR